MKRVLPLFVLSTIAAGAALACGPNDPAPPRGVGETDAGTPDGDANDATYPVGPYGVDPGSVIRNFAWQGWREPVTAEYDADALETITLEDYYDPTGEKGYKAIVLNAAARWCSICKLEQDDIREKRAEWGPKGVVFIETLFQDVAGGPAKPNDLVAWGKTFEIDWVLVLDPNNQLGVFFDPKAAPMNMIVNARTMQIRDIVTGLPDESWWSNHLGPLTAQ